MAKMDGQKTINSSDIKRIQCMKKVRKFSFEMGGMIGESCGPGDGGCRSGKAARKNARTMRRARRSSGDGVVGKVVGSLIGAGAAVGAGLFANKQMKNQQ
jgi:hypothetical protein